MFVEAIFKSSFSFSYKIFFTTFSEISPCHNNSVRNRFGMGTGETCQVLIGADSYKNEINREMVKN